jgi:ABC-2 type transport system permease protein
MTSFAALLKNDIKLFLKDWKVCILLLITPLIFIAFFTYSLTPYLNKTSFIEPFPVALVDMEGTTVTRMLIKQVEEIDVFSDILILEEDEAIKKLSNKEVGAVIILPEDLSVSVAAGENKPVTVIGSSAMPLKAYVVKNIIQSAANLVSSAQSAIITIYGYDKMAGLSGEELEVKYNNAIADYFLEALARSKVFSETEEQMQFSLTPAEYFTAALIVVFMMFAGMPGMKMLVSERSEGITRRLSASPVKMWKVILSKLLVSSLILVIEFGVIVAFTSRIFNNYWGAPVKNILMLFGGIIIAVSAWSVFVAAISTTPASADIIGNLGVLLMAVVGGSIYPLSSMPKFVKGISKFTINRWAMDGFMVVFSGNDAASTGVYAFVLVIMGIVLFLASAIIMKNLRKG